MFACRDVVMVFARTDSGPRCRRPHGSDAWRTFLRGARRETNLRGVRGHRVRESFLRQRALRRGWRVFLDLSFALESADCVFLGSFANTMSYELRKSRSSSVGASASCVSSATQ